MIPPLSLEAQIERLSFEPEPSLAWVAQDRVAVPDIRSGRVILFGSSGQEVKIIGQCGNAPGEFGQPLRVFGTPDGGLIVADLQPPRLTYLSVEGPSALQTASPIPGVPLQILGGDGSGATLAWLEQSQVPVAVVIGNADFQTGDIAARSRIPLPQQSTAVIPAVVMDSSGLIHVGYGTRDQIQSFGDDGTVLGTRGFVDRPPSMPTDAEVQRHRDRMAELIRITGMKLADDEIEQMVSTFERTPSPRFTPTGLSVDASDRLWVLANMPVGDRTPIDVFPRNGSPFQLWVRDRALAVTIRGSAVAVLVERLDGPSRGRGIDIYRIPDVGPWV